MSHKPEVSEDGMLKLCLELCRERSIGDVEDLLTYLLTYLLHGAESFLSS